MVKRIKVLRRVNSKTYVTAYYIFILPTVFVCYDIQSFFSFDKLFTTNSESILLFHHFLMIKHIFDGQHYKTSSRWLLFFMSDGNNLYNYRSKSFLQFLYETFATKFYNNWTLICEEVKSTFNMRFPIQLMMTVKVI